MQNHATKAVLITGIFALLFYPIAATIRAETKTVFRVGTFDESSYEFKSDGIDYANPAQDPVFIAGKSENGKDWFSFQPGSSNGKAGFRPHPFTIEFECAEVPKGIFTLKVGLLSYMARLPRLQVEINGHRGLFYLHPKLNYAGGDTNSVFVPTYSYGTISAQISSRFVMKGSNRLVLTAIDAHRTIQDAKVRFLVHPETIQKKLILHLHAHRTPLQPSHRSRPRPMRESRLRTFSHMALCFSLLGTPFTVSISRAANPANCGSVVKISWCC